MIIGSVADASCVCTSQKVFIEKDLQPFYGILLHKWKGNGEHLQFKVE